jgi:hypothetical protein
MIAEAQTAISYQKWQTSESAYFNSLIGMDNIFVLLL